MKNNNDKGMIHQLYAFYIRKCILITYGIEAKNAFAITESYTAVMDIHAKIPNLGPKTIAKFLSGNIQTPHTQSLDWYVEVIEADLGFLYDIKNNIQREDKVELSYDSFSKHYHFRDNANNLNREFIPKLTYELHNYKYQSSLPYMLNLKSLYETIVLEEEYFKASEIALIIIDSDNTQKLYLLDILKLILELSETAWGKKGAEDFSNRFFDLYREVPTESNKIHKFLSRDVHQIDVYYCIVFLLLKHEPKNAVAHQDKYQDLIYLLLEELQALSLPIIKLAGYVFSQAPSPSLNIFVDYFKKCESAVCMRRICGIVAEELLEAKDKIYFWNIFKTYYWNLLGLNVREAEKLLLKVLSSDKFLQYVTANQQVFGENIIAPIINQNNRYVAKIKSLLQEKQPSLFIFFDDAGFFAPNDYKLDALI